MKKKEIKRRKIDGLSFGKNIKAVNFYGIKMHFVFGFGIRITET